MNFDNNSHIISILEKEKENLRKNEGTLNTMVILFTIYLILINITITLLAYNEYNKVANVFVTMTVVSVIGVIYCVVRYAITHFYILHKISNSIHNFKNEIKNIENNSHIV
jgi:uncharacterized membrane protein YqjE